MVQDEALAEDARQLGRTRAGEVVNAVYASAAVHAPRIKLELSWIVMKVISSGFYFIVGLLMRTWLVLKMDGPRAQLALVVLELAAVAVEVGHAVADVPGVLGEAEGIVAARVVRAHEHHLLAVGPREAEEAGARVLGVQVDAHGPVLARRRHALVDLRVAEVAGPSCKKLCGQ